MANRGFDPVRNHHEKMAYVNHCLRVLNTRSVVRTRVPEKPPVRTRSSSFHARERSRLVAGENERLLRRLAEIDGRPSQHPTTPSRSTTPSTRSTERNRQSGSTMRSISMSRLSANSRSSQVTSVSRRSQVSSISKASTTTTTSTSSSSSSSSESSTSSSDSSIDAQSVRSTVLSKDSLEKSE